MCVTNLQSLPDDLDTKWPMGAIIQIEYSQLIALPLSLIRLKPLFLFLTGNPLTELPPETFEVEGLMYLGISDTNLRELPRNVTHVSPSLSLIEIGNSDISYFWSWVDELVGRADNPAFILAEGSIYCEELKNIQNGTITSFGIPLSPDYSRILMNTSTSNWEAIARIVDCDFVDTPYYPLVYEDEINAISAPPPLMTPQVAQKTPTNGVHLSCWVFAVWWVLMVSAGVVTCAYNALYAYCYWKLNGILLASHFDRDGCVSRVNVLVLINGEYFDVILICREIVEMTRQTAQACRMSKLLPRSIACSRLSWPFEQNQARRRFTCIVFDCLLDLMGVELIVVLSYITDYDPDATDFGEIMWNNDEWTAQALDKFKMVRWLHGRI
ncbi:hypothetical protein JG688_00007445 [Phytophthora aleatoria]|uniref:Uncharacterized protein n=1 Tax=Phytophthora aleatoria TaxID=2496075 RepID=A0A8J5IPF3_9STRA|nr:hypothetical protein JG688_00007445 [Phytophthora aleatoria]